MTMTLIHIIRLVLASCCGIAIGWERKNRAKEAGTRTHFVVACAACLMMLISKYGFTDLGIGELGSKGVDPSRIASQIVSGVGFLGAGMIFVKRQSINGLTTAAGIWATAGIGMAIGSGMYVIGVVSTILILVAQVVLHRQSKLLQGSKSKMLTISGVTEEKYFLTSVKEKLESLHITLQDIDIVKENDKKTYVLYLEIPTMFDEEELIDAFCYNCSIRSN